MTRLETQMAALGPVFDFCSVCGIKGMLRGERPDGFMGPDLEAVDEDLGLSRCLDREPCHLAAELTDRDPA